MKYGNRRAVIGGVLAVVFALFSGCSSEWQVISADDKVFRVNAKTGEVYVLTTPGTSGAFEGKLQWTKATK